MRRRAFLGTAGASLTALAGCLEAPLGGGPSTGTGDDAVEPGQVTTPSGEYELSRGAPKDAIPAIVDPVFETDWSGVELTVTSRFGTESTIEPRLNDGDQVIGIERAGEARAYPLRVLNWHEVCNDDFHGPLLVTYCPLCRSGVTAVRTVDDEATTFGVSGLLWKSNLVMYDEKTESRWSQVAARAIQGPKRGTSLSLVPSTITSWGEWRTAHPETVVLQPPPESSTVRGPEATRNYTTDPYAGYGSSDDVGLGRSDYDGRLHPKTLVIGVATDDVARAYPLGTVEAAGVVNDVVDGRPVVVTTDEAGSLVAYDRRVDGEVLAFEAADASSLAAGGSTWQRSTGRALSGPHEGTTLERANALTPLFWFSWADIHPDSEIYGE